MSKPIIRKVNNRNDWFQALRIIEGKTFVAFAKTARVAAILLNKQIAEERISRQGSFNF